MPVPVNHASRTVILPPQDKRRGGTELQSRQPAFDPPRMRCVVSQMTNRQNARYVLRRFLSTQAHRHSGGKTLRNRLTTSAVRRNRCGTQRAAPQGAMRRSAIRAKIDAPCGKISGSRKKLGLCSPVVPE